MVNPETGSEWNETVAGPSEMTATAEPNAPADALEAGIAAVFEAIRNSEGGAEAAAEETADIADDGTTFALLSELNRLWQQAGA